MGHVLNGRGALMIALAMAVGGCSSSGSSGTAGTGGSPGTGGASGGSGGGSTATGGAGGGGTAKVTTVAGTKAFKDLTDAELTQICNDTFTYFGSSITTATRCKWAGLQASSSSSPTSDAMMQMTCTTHENLCSSADGGAGSNPSCFGSIDPACTATVAQYAACITDETAGFSDIVKGFPACGAVKVSDVPSIMNTEGGAPPASCTTFINACSGLDVPNPLTL